MSAQDNKQITVSCQLCGKPQSVIKLGDLAKQFPDLKPGDDNRVLNGICPVCQKDLDAGCTIFIDKNNRVMKVTVEGTKSKIDPMFWGKVVKIPVSAMEELVRVWATSNHEPPR